MRPDLDLWLLHYSIRNWNGVYYMYYIIIVLIKYCKSMPIYKIPSIRLFPIHNVLGVDNHLFMYEFRFNHRHFSAFQLWLHMCMRMTRTTNPDILFWWNQTVAEENSCSKCDGFDKKWFWKLLIHRIPQTMRVVIIPVNKHMKKYELTCLAKGVYSTDTSHPQEAIDVIKHILHD